MAGSGGREQHLGDEEIVEQGAFVDINVTPLVDIFLVLLVVLMATSTAILEEGQGSGFKVQLPSGSENSELGVGEEQFVVAIPESGVFIFRGQDLTLEELVAVFEKEAAANPERLILVQADEKVFHERVVSVMTAARKAGLVNLAIATKKDP